MGSSGTYVNKSYYMDACSLWYVNVVTSPITHSNITFISIQPRCLGPLHLQSLTRTFPGRNKSSMNVPFHHLSRVCSNKYHCFFVWLFRFRRQEGEEIPVPLFIFLEVMAECRSRTSYSNGSQLNYEQTCGLKAVHLLAIFDLIYYS